MALNKGLLKVIKHFYYNNIFLSLINNFKKYLKALKIIKKVIIKNF
jgi:hypothetical protein